MGHRLVVAIKAFDETIANIYYHWSAYTLSGLLEIKDLLESVDFDAAASKKDLLFRIIRYCEENGGGLSSLRDFVVAKKIFPNISFRTDADRNYGLVAITEDTMNESQNWSEGDALIDFDEDMIEYGVYLAYDSVEDFNAELLDMEMEPITLNELPKINVNPGRFCFEDIYSVLEDIEDAGGYFRYGDQVYQVFK